MLAKGILIVTNRNKKLFDDIVDDVKRDDSAAPRRTLPSHLLERTNRLSEINSGELVEKTLRLVDPDRCRMWPSHNRRYDLLNEQRCADLIEGFKAQGKQEFPAIVRKIEGDADHDYEVVCGARRHWTVAWLQKNNYPQFRFLIEVRQLTDEEAFRLSDVENRDRLDISDYERALDYKSALELYYKTQKQMAKRLEVSEGYLSKYLDLAEMPNTISDCYADVTHIRVHHWTTIKALLKDKKQREAVMAKAAELSLQQSEASRQGSQILDGAQIVNVLKQAATNSRQSQRNARVLAEYRAASTGNRLMTVAKDGRRGYVFRLATDAGANRDEVIQTFIKALDSYIEMSSGPMGASANEDG
jgi:ParB family chromosome partitioning protein